MQVTRVVQALESANMFENTVLIWQSDNGAAIEENTGYKSGYPLRGGYYTNWDGRSIAEFVYTSFGAVSLCRANALLFHRFQSFDHFSMFANGYFATTGGVRAPGLVNGGFLRNAIERNNVPSGQALTGLVHIADWYATFCALAGVDPEDKPAAAQGDTSLQFHQRVHFFPNQFAAATEKQIVPLVRFCC